MQVQSIWPLVEERLTKSFDITGQQDAGGSYVV